MKRERDRELETTRVGPGVIETLDNRNVEEAKISDRLKMMEL